MQIGGNGWGSLLVRATVEEEEEEEEAVAEEEVKEA